MQIGFNFTLPGTLEMAQGFLRDKKIDYCEVLMDNFVHIPAKEFIDAFQCPIAFHVMLSRFVESDETYLDKFGARLREYIREMKPLYVSDHLARFSHDGHWLYHLGELDYVGQYDHIKSRVARWQDRLGARLYLENYPSIMEGGWDAPEFYEKLCRETGVGVLFDASNAVCAMHNTGAPLDLWSNIIASTPHFHVAGYGESFVEPHVIMDTHDRELADDTIAFLKSKRGAFDKAGATITYERDINFDVDSISADLERLRTIFSHHEEKRDECDLVASAG